MTRATCEKPALLTTTSRRPNSCRRRRRPGPSPPRARRRADAPRAKPRPRAASPPSPSACPRPGPRSRSPSRPRRAAGAVAFPIPLPAPVTNATRPRTGGRSPSVADGRRGDRSIRCTASAEEITSAYFADMSKRFSAWRHLAAVEDAVLDDVDLEPARVRVDHRRADAAAVAPPVTIRRRCRAPAAAPRDPCDRTRTRSASRIIDVAGLGRDLVGERIAVALSPCSPSSSASSPGSVRASRPAARRAPGDRVDDRHPGRRARPRSPPGCGDRRHRTRRCSPSEPARIASRIGSGSSPMLLFSTSTTTTAGRSPIPTSPPKTPLA